MAATGHKIYVRRDYKNLGYKNAHLLVKKAAVSALKEEGIDVPCEINVLFTNDAGIHEINLENRGIDAPTDVLSFPMNELTPGEFDPDLCEIDPETECIYLGDMAISLERCEAQGEEFGHGFEREICYLTVHSVLHLLGYDHLDEGEDKRLMRSREKAICVKMGLEE